MNFTYRPISALFLSFSIAITANAALYDRGNGLIYDSTLNITWLQDFNYAQTSGFDDDGRMTWDDGKAWAESLIYHGYSGWRLPSAGLDGSGRPGCLGSSSCPGWYDGTFDSSYNNTRSEIGHLFFNDLNNKAAYDLSNTLYPIENYGLTNTDFIDQSTGTIRTFYK